MSWWGRRDGEWGRARGGNGGGYSTPCVALVAPVLIEEDVDGHRLPLGVDANGAVARLRSGGQGRVSCERPGVETGGEWRLPRASTQAPRTLTRVRVCVRSRPKRLPCAKQQCVLRTGAHTQPNVQLAVEVRRAGGRRWRG